MTLPVIFDTDPGIDDAAAIAVLLTNPAFDVRLMTSVAGNVNVDKTTLNIQKLVHFFKRDDVKIARGAEKPLRKPFEDASHIHGESGMPGYDFGDFLLPEVLDDAPAQMAKVLNESAEPITIIAVGAFTNLAHLIQRFPESLAKIDRVVVMGGSLSGGNMTSVAEFNVFTDPDAAEVLFKSGLDITMIGLDVTLKALLTPDIVTTLAESNATGKMLTDMMAFYADVRADGGKPMHDVNTLFYLLAPEKYVLRDFWVDVVTDGPALGATVADVRGAYHDTTNVNVALDIDRAAFETWFVGEISGIADADVRAV